MALLLVGGCVTTDPDAADLCSAVDPATDATLVVDDSEWPSVPEGELDPNVVFDAPCTIIAVDPLADPVTTDLECMDGDVVRGLGLSLPAHDEPIAWAVGDAVTVARRRQLWPEGYGSFRDDLTVRRASDGALLLASMHQEALYPDTFAPLTLSVDEDRCAPESTDLATWNLVTTFESGAGESIELGHLQRGSLDASDGEGRWVIDVEEAQKGDRYCCHELRGLQVLVRRTP